MIIKRKYVPFGILVQNDPKAKKIYLNAFKKSNLPIEEQNRIIEYNRNNSVFDWEMGCGIPNPELIVKGFEKLDKNDPYDNGYTFKDVFKMDIFEKDEYGISYFLLNKYDERIKVVSHSFSPFEYMKIDRLGHYMSLDFPIEIKNEKNVVFYRTSNRTNNDWKFLQPDQSEKWLSKLSELNINKWKRKYSSKEAYVFDGHTYEIEYKELDSKIKKFEVSNAWPENFEIFIELIDGFIPKIKNEEDFYGNE